jgi:aryl-alcohol dehydrogenase-like predicted oxidoreductase
MRSERELQLCDRLGIAFLPDAPRWNRPGRHLGVRFPSFQRVAEETGATPQQVTLAWMLAQSPRVIPIPGSSRPETIRPSAAAVDLMLAAEQLDGLSA